MTNGSFHCPACGEVMKGPTHCGHCLWDADTCGYAYTAPQAECAPREAQPVDQWLRDLRRAHEYLDKGEPFFTGKDCAELADLIESLASPTPEKDQRSCDLERADVGKDAARVRWLRGQMGYRRLEELFGSGSYTHEMIDARIDAAILAADKEPK